MSVRIITDSASDITPEECPANLTVVPLSITFGSKVYLDGVDLDHDRFYEMLIESDGVAERGTFIVNPEGKIVAYEVNAGNVGRNADELFRKLQALKFVAEHGDEVCPAKWKPGNKTLKPSLDLVGAL